MAAAQEHPDPNFFADPDAIGFCLSVRYPLQIGEVNITQVDLLIRKTSREHAVTYIAVDRTSALFIAELGINRVRKIDVNGVITTVASNGTAGASGDGGPATRARVGDPLAVAVDGDGVLYIAQRGRIRKVDRDGVISYVNSGRQRVNAGAESRRYAAGRSGRSRRVLDTSRRPVTIRSKDAIAHS